MQTRHAFEAEVSQLLELVIGSLYTRKEIFLRELVSNAQDALDKLRFRAVTEPELMAGDGTLEVRIRVDAEPGVLVIEDTGVGMTEAELAKNLGTLAHSGTKAFLEKLGERRGDVSLIGQFGVGFYSAFLVADRVDVVSRAAGHDQAFRWSSDAKNGFTIEPAERAARGTEIRLHLKADLAKEYLDRWHIKDLVRQYSDYVSYPVKLEVEKEGPDGQRELEQINRAKALWQRPKAEISSEEYEELYKHITHDYEPHLAHTHFKVEGTMEFLGLLYVPRRAPFDLFNPSGKRGLRLFVRRVFILEDAQEILPVYLRFLRGVVDSDDRPLNVSRETLQESRVLHAIKKQVTKKALDLLDDLAKDKPEDYAIFWKAFGAVLKEGLAGDSAEKDRIAKLLRAPSTKEAAGGLASFDAYKTRMPEDQKAIYYLYGESEDVLRRSPYLEALEKKGFEVLFFTDPVDEWAMSGLGEYDKTPLVSAMRADLELEKTAEETEKERKDKEALSPLLTRITKVLGDRVREVKLSDRLTDSPACLVLTKTAAPAFMEKLLRESGRKVPHEKRIFEINAAHPLMKNLASKIEVESANVEGIDGWIEVLYDQALLSEGSPLEDPNGFARRVTAMLVELSAR